MANQSCCQRLLKGVDADFAIFDFGFMISHNPLNPFRVIFFDRIQQLKIPHMAFIPYLIGSHKYLNQKSIFVFSDRAYSPNQTFRLTFFRTGQERLITSKEILASFSYLSVKPDDILSFGKIIPFV